MRTDIIFLWSYFASFFSEWETFQSDVVQKIKTHILCSGTYFLKSCCLWDNVEKYCRAGQVTDGNIIWHMHIACWLQTHTQNMQYLLLSHNSGYTSAPAPRCYVIRAWLSCYHCDIVASVRWELVLNIKQVMFSLPMINYTWSFWCWASHCASWYRLTVSTSWVMLILIRNIISWQHVSAILLSSSGQRSVKVKLRPHNIKLYKLCAAGLRSCAYEFW